MNRSQETEGVKDTSKNLRTELGLLLASIQNEMHSALLVCKWPEVQWGHEGRQLRLGG